MRRFRFWPQMALMVTVATMNGGCILYPEIKDRLVELAVAGTTSATFTVQGSSTSVDETAVVDVGADLNLAQILEDAGIDASQVTHVALSGVTYRIVRADPDASREFLNGTITIQRGTGAVENLVTGLSASPGAVSGFQAVPLEVAGVGVLNQMLDDILAALPGAPADGSATFHLTGESTSGSGNPADFDIEVKITVSITGKINVSVPT